MTMLIQPFNFSSSISNYYESKGVETNPVQASNKHYSGDGASLSAAGSKRSALSASDAECFSLCLGAGPLWWSWCSGSRLGTARRGEWRGLEPRNPIHPHPRRQQPWLVKRIAMVKRQFVGEQRGEPTHGFAAGYFPASAAPSRTGGKQDSRAKGQAAGEDRVQDIPHWEHRYSLGSRCSWQHHVSPHARSPAVRQ